jgi:hypothetical protein
MAESETIKKVMVWEFLEDFSICEHNFFYYFSDIFCLGNIWK